MHGCREHRRRGLPLSSRTPQSLPAADYATPPIALASIKDGDCTARKIMRRKRVRVGMKGDTDAVTDVHTVHLRASSCGSPP